MQIHLHAVHSRQARREIAGQWARIRRLIRQCHSWGWYDVAAMLRVSLRKCETAWNAYRS
jgi:hypothetical protein